MATIEMNPDSPNFDASLLSDEDYKAYVEVGCIEPIDLHTDY